MSYVDPMDHCGLAVIIARQYRCKRLDESDLLQEAMLMVCEAARTYDPAKGEFSTWAGNLIHSRLKSVVFRYNNIGTLGVGRNSLSKELRQHLKTQDPDMSLETTKRLLRANPRWNSTSDWDVAVTLNLLAGEISLDSSNHEGPITDHRSLVESIEDEVGTEAREGWEKVVGLSDKLGAATEKFTDMYRDVALNRVLNLDDPDSQVDIGKRWGVSRQRVEQVERRVRKVLKDIIRA